MLRTPLAHLLLALTAVCAAPAAGDWLVTAEGTAIETDGPWKVKGRLVVFTDAQGTLRSLRRDEIDLEASEARTAGAEPEALEAPAAADTEEPRERTERRPVLVLTNDDVARAAEDRPAAELTPRPRVVLYSTSWCGFCRKTRQLLGQLKVDFVEKDIEKSAEARREHAAKAGGRGGVPVLDFDGTIVRGYRPEVIRRLAARTKRPGEEEGEERAGG